MPNEIMIPVIISVLVFAAAIGGIIYSARYRRQFFYSYRSHEIVVRISSLSIALIVDGKVEDEFAAQNVRLCTLRAFIEGDEVKARVQLKIRPQVEVTAGGNELTCMSVGK